MNTLTDQVLDEWSSLVEREESAAYKVQRWRASTALEANQNEICRGISLTAAVREEICEWFYRIVDHCDIDRGVVSIALSYFDRYLSHHSSMNEKLMQLVAMASIYLAVKTHSTRKISISSITVLSRGRFREDQILKMEECIMSTLQWYLNPPTPSVYLSVVTPLIREMIDDEEGFISVQELSTYLLELSACDGYFVVKKPSSVARAAILVAMDVLDFPTKKFLRYPLEHSPSMTDLCTKRLLRIYKLAMQQMREDGVDFSGRAGPPSPTTVMYE